jgi:anti-sigma factor RsiW
MHLAEGTLRTYLDGELDEADQRRIAAHLAGCPACRAQAERASERWTGVHQAMDLLGPPAGQPLPSTRHVRARWEARLEALEQESHVMKWSTLFHRYRPAWLVGLAAVAVAVMLAVPPVRARAVEFLQLFRVQRLEVVQIDPAQLADNMGATTQIQQMLADQVQVEELGEPQAAASADEAGAMAELPVRLPMTLGEPARLVVQPGVHLSFQVDLPRARALLAGIGREDIRLPDNLDGATVEARLPRSVTASYGHCPMGELTERELDQNDERFAQDCLVLVQLPTPAVSAPADLDVKALGKAFLQVMGLSEEEATQFSQKVDWATTLVVPIPRYDATYREVPVDGVDGTLIEQARGDIGRGYAILWIKDGIVYALSGRGNPARGLEAANSLGGGTAESTR